MSGRVTTPALPSVRPLPDPSILVEADGDEEGRKTLKLLRWPLMDEDARPCTYVPKVITCLSIWQVKMKNLANFFLTDGDGEAGDHTQLLVL